MELLKTRQKVLNRGIPPVAFLEEVIQWARQAPEDIFAARPDPQPPEHDIYTWIKPVLGPWEGAKHRRAVMMEVMRVHAGFESSWNWKLGVDTTNATSMRNITGQETGIFQVSFDSTYLDHGAMKPFAKERGIDTPEKLIPAMKADHGLAMEYYARLLRHSIRWAGPIVRHEINGFLKRDAVSEFMAQLG